MGTGNSVGVMQSRPWLRPKYLLFGFIGLIFGYVLVTRETFLINPHDPRWLHISSFKWWLLPHGLAGTCALLLGPLQFSDRLRQRHTGLHHAVGRIYIAGTLIAAPLGVYIQYFDERLGGSRSFTILTMVEASLWILTTVIALACILNGKVQQHRRWMARSYAVPVCGFLGTRVILGVFGLDKFGQPVAEIVVMVCVASSIFLADVVLQIEELLRARPVEAKAEAAEIVTVP